MNFVVPILSLGLLGLGFGVMLGIATKKLAIEVDPRQSELLESLPGANCGACGFPGCSGYAAAIVEGKAGVTRCPVGGNRVAKKLAEIMGIEVTDAIIRRVARVRCRGDRENAPDKFEYNGVRSCRAAQLVSGGPKACSFGCLGFGTCVQACRFGAIKMTPAGIPVVDAAACTACGKCVEACPRDIITLSEDAPKACNLCMSHDRGPEVKKVCKVGCIGCGICAKACPQSAILMDEQLAVVDTSKCDGCGICVEKCPVKCLVLFDQAVSERPA